MYCYNPMFKHYSSIIPQWLLFRVKGLGQNQSLRFSDFQEWHVGEVRPAVQHTSPPGVWLDVRSCLLSGDRCILEAHTHATFSGSAGSWSCLPLMLWTLTSWSEYEYHTQLQNCSCNCSFFLCKEYTFVGPETTIRQCKYPISHQTQILRTHLFRSAWIHEFLFHSVLIMTLIFKSPQIWWMESFKLVPMSFLFLYIFHYFMGQYIPGSTSAFNHFNRDSDSIRSILWRKVLRRHRSD